jgi:hypothetical protein
MQGMIKELPGQMIWLGAMGTICGSEFTSRASPTRKTPPLSQCAQFKKSDDCEPKIL